MPSSIAHTSSPPAGEASKSVPRPLSWTGQVTTTDATGAAAVSCTMRDGSPADLQLSDDQREALGLMLVAPGADGMVCVCPEHGVSVEPAGKPAAETERDDLRDLLAAIRDVLDLPSHHQRPALLDSRVLLVLGTVRDVLDGRVPLIPFETDLLRRKIREDGGSGA